MLHLYGVFQSRIIGYDVRVHFIQSKYLAQIIITDKVQLQLLQITQIYTPEVIKFLCIAGKQY